MRRRQDWVVTGGCGVWPSIAAGAHVSTNARYNLGRLSRLGRLGRLGRLSPITAGVAGALATRPPQPPDSIVL